MAIGSHIIPKFYLDRFANPPDRRKGQQHLWVHRKNKEPNYRATSVQGSENGYFAFVRPDGKLDESLETRLEKLEEACLDTLVLTATPFFDFSASRRNDLAFYSAMLFCRATQRRNRTQKAYAELHLQFADLVHDDEWIARTALLYAQKHGEPITPRQIKERLAHIAAMMEGTTALRNNFVEDLVASTEILKGFLLQKPWQLWNAPQGVEFVTSDNPLISFVPVGNGELNPGHGFRKPETTAAFPLAPHVCLAMGVKGPDAVTINASRVMKINETVIRLCDRFVYSKTRSEEVRLLVEEYANTARYGENAFLPLGLRVPTAKDFVLHTMDLAPPPFPTTN